VERTDVDFRGVTRCQPRATTSTLDTCGRKYSPARIDVVAELSPTADANSRTFLIKLDLPQSAALRAGQFGRAAIPVGQAKSLRVPAALVVRRGQMEIVFVAQGGVAKLRLVKTGKKIGDDLEILSGLSSGDAVILDSGLVDGQKVEVRK